MTSKTALIFATTAAIALASFDMRPAAAAPEGGPAIVKQNAGADEFSSQRKRRRGRGVNPAVPLAAFGAIVGTIGAVAAANAGASTMTSVITGRAMAITRSRATALPAMRSRSPIVRHHYGSPRSVITTRRCAAGAAHRPARSSAVRVQGRARPHADAAGQHDQSPLGRRPPVSLNVGAATDEAAVAQSRRLCWPPVTPDWPRCCVANSFVNN